MCRLIRVRANLTCWVRFLEKKRHVDSQIADWLGARRAVTRMIEQRSGEFGDDQRQPRDGVSADRPVCTETGRSPASAMVNCWSATSPDGDEAAFEALVNLHGPMVLGLCRRVLRDPRDIEDAFQATFLILVRKAPTIRDRRSVVELALRRGLPGRAAGAGTNAPSAASRDWC